MQGPLGASTALRTNHRANVSVTTIQARTACALLMVSQSSGMRDTSLESPACGPEPVTTVPTMISATVAAVRIQTSCRTAVPTRGRGSASPSRVRCHITVATAISAVDSRKWAETVYGLRPTRTTMPPRTALPMTSQNWVQPSRVRPRRHGFCERAAMIAQPTAAHRTYVSMRLPNSMAPWKPISLVAVRDWSVHLGHVGQPRPEPVRRTAPPVTTMTTVMTTAESAARRTVR